MMSHYLKQYFFIFISIFCLFIKTNYANEGSQLFAKVKKSLYLIKISVNETAPKSSYGSGFAISQDGLIMTNYHVISEVIHDEENKYKIFVEELNSNSNSNKTYHADLIALDVVQDLALIKIDKQIQNDSFLRLSKDFLEKGERIFSFGVPKDLNQVIVEGTFNGVIKYGIYQQLHLSSPLNSGMSGGPIVNSKGEVIGVNVSVLLDSQNISFGVPVNFVQNLMSLGIGKSQDQKKENNFHEMIEKQLLAVADSMESSLTRDLEISTIDQFIIAKSKSMLKCWSYYKNSKELTYVFNKQTCQLNGAVFIKGDQYVGSYNVGITTINNKTRNPLQYFNLLDIFYNESNYSYAPEDEDFLSSPICRELLIHNKHNIPFKINYCLMPYKKYKKLLDLDIKAISLLREDSNLMIDLHLYGVRREHIMTFIRSYLDPIRKVDEKT